MRRVFDYSLVELQNVVHLDRFAGVMDHHDCAGFASEARFDRATGDVLRVQLHIAEHGRASSQHDSVCTGDPGE